MQFIQDNVIWVALAFVSGAMLLWPVIRGRTAGNGVSPLQATLMINREDAVVVDIREADEYARGHVPNAKHIPLGQFEKRLQELAKFKEKPVIVMCQSGNRSLSACGLLRKAGFDKVFHLAGGITGWEQAGQPVTAK